MVLITHGNTSFNEKGFSKIPGISLRRENRNGPDRAVPFAPVILHAEINIGHYRNLLPLPFRISKHIRWTDSNARASTRICPDTPFSIYQDFDHGLFLL
jgi:hypothetical protein